MDGSSFKSSEGDGAIPSGAGLAIASDPLTVDGLVGAAAKQDDRRHWFGVLAAAAAHLVLIAAILPARTDAMGEGGVSLETIAVSIVDTVPMLSAPVTSQPDAGIQPPDAEADDAGSEAPAAKPEEAVVETKPDKQALALDLPPEATPPPPDALALPARQPDAERDPTPVVIEETPPLREPPREAATPAPAPAPAAPAASPSVSSAEATSGAVRAYAVSVSRVLDRHKPRNRGIKGQVRIQFVIDPTGRAEAPRVLATSGNTNLDSLVVTAIQSMSFPAPPPEMSPRQRTFNVPFAFR